MSPRQFYASNILSALAWAPAHVFPGVLLAMALRLTSASAEERTILVIVGLIVATFIIFACVYRKPKRGHSGDEARQGSDAN
jgi:membrane protein DedA with SNARE-associated domain